MQCYGLAPMIVVSGGMYTFMCIVMHVCVAVYCKQFIIRIMIERLNANEKLQFQDDTTK